MNLFLSNIHDSEKIISNQNKSQQWNIFSELINDYNENKWHADMVYTLKSFC